MKKLLLTISLSLMLTTTVFSQDSFPCTFTWDKVTTYTNGSIITIPVKYKLYFKPQGSTTIQAIADTDLLTATVLCPAGEYYVTAYTASDAESTKSISLILNQASSPVNLRWTK